MAPEVGLLNDKELIISIISASWDVFTTFYFFVIYDGLDKLECYITLG
jgi:hypothetical protein